MPVFHTLREFSANNENAISMIVWKKGVPWEDQATLHWTVQLDLTVFQHIDPG